MNRAPGSVREPEPRVEARADHDLRRGLPTAALLVAATTLATLAAAAALARPAAAQDAAPRQPQKRAPLVGPWRAWLDSPGGELPFGLFLSRDFSDEGTGWHAQIENGAETIVAPLTSYDEQSLVIDIDNYAARITAAGSDDGQTLLGTWTCDRGPKKLSRLVFHAKAGAAPRFPVLADAGPPDPIDGRWAVRFASDDETMVGVLQRAADGTVAGTILSSTGDYRYLAGDARGGRLLLSAFDGAHAYLLDARRQPDAARDAGGGNATGAGAEGTEGRGTPGGSPADDAGDGDAWAGDFWAGDTGHDTFTMRRDGKAALPDAFGLVHARPGADVDGLAFPDLDGTPRSLGEPAFAGKARVIEIFGSWCPNCHDETVDLLALQKRYAGRGLSILGLAFERSGDPARDVAQVRKYAQRHGVTWPLLLAGVADREKAAAALPVIDRVHAFPTTLFVRADGTIAAVHTGYSGPATGAAHDELLAAFAAQIDALLAGRGP